MAKMPCLQAFTMLDGSFACLLWQKHATTSQLSYQGAFLELTEAISSLPVGGQTLLSNQTLQLASDREQVQKARNADSNKVCHPDYPWHRSGANIAQEILKTCLGHWIGIAVKDREIWI